MCSLHLVTAHNAQVLDVGGGGELSSSGEAVGEHTLSSGRLGQSLIYRKMLLCMLVEAVLLPGKRHLATQRGLRAPFFEHARLHSVVSDAWKRSCSSPRTCCKEIAVSV